MAARNELKEALREMNNNNKVKDFLSQNECNWIEFQTNVPAASHKGGSWEKRIRAVRNVLNALLNQSGTQLDETAAIVYV